MKYQELRKKHPKFIYEKYSYGISKNPRTRAFGSVRGRNLEIVFDFKIPPDIFFQPKMVIEDIPPKLKIKPLENLIFHLGLMEIPSYWKATCSPLIEIRAGYLNQEQIKWWKKLLIDGMGQFYYENKIDWRKKGFLSIRINSTMVALIRHQKKLKGRYLVPFAGGRDSIVTMEGLKKQKKDIALFTVNPIEKIQKVVRVSGIKKQIVVRRLIDKKLLELNKKGYLNGHTPFTSVLSFISVLCAVLFDYKNIVFSNEKSADEGNVKYLGKMINHQWAKSSEFEKMFRFYIKKYITPGVEYFSYLRKYGELEISQMLIKYPKYFPVFSSCNNRGVRWCCNCPKCLFVYMTLYPFLKEKDLLKIFDKDIFDPSTGSRQEKLLSIMQQLIGERGHKPFECVGTFKESRQAFKLSVEKSQKSGKIPHLLTKLK